MANRLAFCLVPLMLAIGASGIYADEPIPAPALRQAGERGLDLLVKTSPTFIKKGGCNSCHNQMLPAAAQALARKRGLVVGEPIEQLPAERSEASVERYTEYSAAGGAGINALAFELFADGLAGVPLSARSGAKIRYIRSQQEPDGHWRGADSLTSHGQQALSRPSTARPPLMFDDFTATAFMIRALHTYARSGDEPDTMERISRARHWLLRAKPRRLQEYAFRTLGLTWSSADRSSIDRASRALQALQHRSGGFSQLTTLPPDAYATGMALYALSEAGVPSTQPTYQAGLKYLLTNQAADGTWHVKSRSLEFQPYFESGYPYGRDQWISAAASSYAILAIAAAIEPPQSTRR